MSPRPSGGSAGPAGDGAAAVDVDAVAAAATACRTVVALSGGPLGSVATYLPGRRVTGVRVSDDTVAVHVVGVYGPSLTEIGTEVRAALAPLAGGRQIEIVVEDLVTPVSGTEPSR